MQQGTKVQIVDDDIELCKSLKFLIESVGLEVVSYHSAGEFLTGVDLRAPGCIIIDIRMPGMSGLELQNRLVTEGVRTPVIFLSGFADVPIAVHAMKVGAVDVLEKPFSEQVLLDRIHECIRRDAQVRDAARLRNEIASKFEKITPREREVISLVVSGESTAKIAAKLGVSVKTIEVHRANIMTKCQAGSLAELVRWTLLIDNKRI